MSNLNYSDKKVLCIGNQSKQTDDLVKQIAQNYNLKNLGLIVNPTADIDANGFYHTSLADIDISAIGIVAAKFDIVIFLQQGIESYDDEELYYTTKHALLYIQNRLKIPLEIREVL